jgi:hypothetical protein
MLKGNSLNDPGSSDNPSGVYGMVLLNPSYSGPVFQARRDGNQATQDFYTHTDGSYWTTPDSSGKKIDTWLNGATAYCSKWYDQSGAGNHALQTNSDLQPIVDYVNFAMDFTAQGGTAYFSLPSGTVPQVVAYTVTVKHGVINNEKGGWLAGGNTVDNQANSFRRQYSSYVNYWWGSDFHAGTYAPGNIVTFKYDGSAVVYMYTNGALTASRTQTGVWSGVAGNEFLGQGTDWNLINNPTRFNGVLYYVYLFKSALSDAKRIAIEAGAYGNVEDPATFDYLY